MACVMCDVRWVYSILDRYCDIRLRGWKGEMAVMGGSEIEICSGRADCSEWSE